MVPEVSPADLGDSGRLRGGVRAQVHLAANRNLSISLRAAADTPASTMPSAQDLAAPSGSPQIRPWETRF